MKFHGDGDGILKANAGRASLRGRAKFYFKRAAFGERQNGIDAILGSKRR